MTSFHLTVFACYFHQRFTEYAGISPVVTLVKLDQHEAVASPDLNLSYIAQAYQLHLDQIELESIV